MSEERLSPERSVRLLRAKAGELEAFAARLPDDRTDVDPVVVQLAYQAADIALVATLLADHMEHTINHGPTDLHGAAHVATRGDGSSYACTCGAGRNHDVDTPGQHRHGP